MSAGSGGPGLVLRFGAGSTPDVVAEVRDAAIDFPEGPRIDMSSHDTVGVRDTKGSFAEAGTLRITLVEVLGDTGQSAIRDALGDGVDYPWDIVYENGDGASGMGSVVGYSDAAPFGDAQTAIATLRLPAKPTWTPAGS